MVSQDFLDYEVKGSFWRGRLLFRSEALKVFFRVQQSVDMIDAQSVEDAVPSSLN